MTLKGAIAQLIAIRDDYMMPVFFKPCFDKVIETISECKEPSTQPEIVLCKDCVFGHLYFDVRNGIDIDSWVECINPDGLYRDVSCEGYCSAAIRRKGK